MRALTIAHREPPGERRFAARPDMVYRPARPVRCWRLPGARARERDFAMVDKILADQKPADGKPGKKFYPAAADISNIANLGHPNANIAHQPLATHYYISALGPARAPFLNTGVRIM